MSSMPLMRRHQKTLPLHWLVICAVTVFGIHILFQRYPAWRFNPIITNHQNITLQDEALSSNLSDSFSDEGLMDISEITQPVMVVLVASTARSGSTFLGELLAARNEAVHFFEPFWYCDTHEMPITKDMHLHPDSSPHPLAQTYLLSLLNCSLSLLPPMFDESLDMKIWRKPQLPHLSDRQREQLCHDLKLRVVKAVRPGLGSVLPLLMEPDINLHVFHLVRDPRAVANSVLKKEGWIDMFPTSMICENIRESLRVLREFNKTELLEQRYTLVRYEDLVADPEMVARRLFRRLGFRLPDNVLRFISTHSKRHYTSPAILREETTLQPSTTTTRRPSTARNPPRKQLLTFMRWIMRKHRTATTTTEAGPIIIPTSAPDVHDYFGTVRDASFNGLQWLEELPAEKRREVESQ